MDARKQGADCKLVLNKLEIGFALASPSRTEALGCGGARVRYTIPHDCNRNFEPGGRQERDRARL